MGILMECAQWVVIPGQETFKTRKPLDKTQYGADKEVAPSAVILLV
jgi:hypothetical protein